MGARFASLLELEKGIVAFVLFAKTGLSATRSDARRLIKDGGGYVNNRRVEKFDEIISAEDVHDGIIMLRAGKKRYHKLVLR